MKEASSSSSPLFSPKTPNAGAAAAAPAAERQVLPALRVKPSCCSASLSSSPSSSSSVHSSNSSSSFFSSHLGYSPTVPSSPFVCSSSAVPFSWEKQPGVPKHISHRTKEHPLRWAPGQRLPPPPPLRSNSEPFLSVPRKKRPDLSLLADPFAVALMECSKDDDRRVPDQEGPFWEGAAPARSSSRAVGRRRRTIADLLGFVDLYTSCKTTSSVANSTVYVPRSGRGMAAYGLLSRRAG